MTSNYISGSSSKLGHRVAFHHCTLLLDADEHLLRFLLQPAYVSYVNFTLDVTLHVMPMVK